MKKIMKKAIATMMTFAAIGCMSCINAFAATNTTVIVSTDQEWTDLDPVSRTGRFSYVAMRVFGVYPTNGGVDNFRYIQGTVKNESGTQICSVVVLDERSSEASYPSIIEGHLGSSEVTFRFRGNSPNYGARANVFYNAM
ncbi:MAG: hypothetical protein E7510_11740 [Ruminococcus sp.]|nr:hypothetical protein [Ruminococcus sp.]